MTTAASITDHNREIVRKVARRPVSFYGFRPTPP
jgi:hypothetical protein